MNILIYFLLGFLLVLALIATFLFGFNLGKKSMSMPTMKWTPLTTSVDTSQYNSLLDRGNYLEEKAKSENQLYLLLKIFIYADIFWIFREPKKFIGGDLYFPEINHKVSVRNNMGVLFPSWLNHEVDKIEMYDKMDRFNSNGRFCFSTFFHIR